MKYLITENQYKQLKKHLVKKGISEASLRKKLGMAALGAGLSFGSPEAKGQYLYSPDFDTTNLEVEPSGRFGNKHYSPVKNKYIDLNINNNIITFDNVKQLIFLIDDNFYLPEYRHLHIPINLPNGKEPFDSLTIQNVKSKFIEIITDTLNAKTGFGKITVPKGYSSQDEYTKKNNFFKRFSIGLNPKLWRNLPIKKVIISDKIIEEFLELVRDGKTNFGFSNIDGIGTTLYNKYPYAHKFGKNF